MEEIHFGLVGVGGFGREVMPVAQSHLERALGGKGVKIKYYFVQSHPDCDQANGIQSISVEDFLALDGKRLHNIAISNYVMRKALAEQLTPHSEPVDIIAQNSTNLGFNEVGPGIIQCPFTTITVNGKIGRYCHLNIYSYIAHDCVIGDYVTFAPLAACNGNVHIHNYAYIGTNAIIKQGTDAKPLVIGEGAVVGMGAVVTKDVAPYTTVIGNPARPMEKKLSA